MSDTKANILIVDDDDGGRYLKAHVLRKHGYNVTEAASGIAAIEQCCLAAPDLVLLDVMLPDVHGFEVSRRIKATNPGIAIRHWMAGRTAFSWNRSSLMN
jgi:CheY-like chemotaxis protein